MSVKKINMKYGIAITNENEDIKITYDDAYEQALSIETKEDMLYLTKEQYKWLIKNHITEIKL